MTPKHRKFIAQRGIADEAISPSLSEAIALYDKGEKRLKGHPEEADCLSGLLPGWDGEILAQLTQEFPQPPDPKGNDAILKKLFDQGKTTQIPRSLLLTLGFECDWKAKKITTKNYLLERSSLFYYIFSLKKS